MMLHLQLQAVNSVGKMTNPFPIAIKLSKQRLLLKQNSKKDTESRQTKMKNINGKNQENAAKLFKGGGRLHNVVTTLQEIGFKAIIDLPAAPNCHTCWNGYKACNYSRQ